MLKTLESNKMKLKLSLVAVAVLGTLSAHAQTSPQMYITPEGKTMTLEQYETTTILSRIGAPQAWARGYTGKGIKIAVLDQGFDLGHADLKSNIIGYQNFYAGSIASKNANWGYHGTGMASAAAGALNNGVGTVGVAYNASLLLAQVGQGGTMPNIDTTAVVKALNWAGTNGATVVNMSFGSTYDPTFVAGTKQIATGVYQGNPIYGSMYGQTSTYKAYQTSTNKSSVVVVAAGNGDRNGVGLPYAGFPAAFAAATDSQGNLTFGGRWLIVGSVDANNKLSSFSNAAGHVCTNLVAGVCKDVYQVKDFYVVAPGERVVVAQDKNATAEYLATFSTGTSPATALVSGGIALMKQAWPQLKAAELVQLVKSTATDLGKPGVDEVYGHGLVNFDKATQPYADVKYSKVVLKSGTVAGGVTLNNTGIATSGPVGTALMNSNVLKNVQVVDGINRNFTADFTRAIGTSTAANSLYTSPYLAMQSLGYREFAVPAGKDTVMTFMQSANGFASQFETAYGSGKLSMQVGAMAEQSGFLNNVGSGLFATSGSKTTYAMVGGSKPLTESVDLIGSYGLGITKTSNVDGSLLAVAPTLVSDTWKLGLAKKDIFFSGKTQDQFTVALHGPVAIRRGHADVTAVTGYSYSGEEDNVSATPTMTTERVNLASGRRQTDLIVGYSVSVNNTTYAGINFARQFNIGGIQGQTGNAVGVMVRSVF